MNWNPRDFCRLIGIVTSGSRASIAPVRVSREDIAFVRDEMLAVIDDVDEGRRYLGITKGFVKRDLALDASALPTSFEPEKTHTYAAPSMVGYVEIIGEISSCNGIELSFSIPRPGSYVYIVVDGTKLKRVLSLAEGLRIGVHKFSSMDIPLDPKALSYHIAVLGATGTGKSRLAKCIVEEALRFTDYSVIVFDHTGVDYADRSRWSPDIDVEVVDASKITLDPDVISQIIVDETGITGYHEDYIYGAVVEYIRRKVLEQMRQENSGKAQTIPRAHDIDMETAIALYRDLARKNVFTWSFSEFLQTLEDYVRKLGGYESTIRKFKLLISTRIGRSFFENYLNNRYIVVEDIVDRLLNTRRKLIVVDTSSEVEYTAKRGLIYQFMKIIWDRILVNRSRAGRILAVVDEAHNYTCTHGCDPAKSIIARTAREGRKWGFGLVLVSQRIIDLAPEIRGNTNTVFFSRLQSSGDYNELKNWLEGVQYLEYTLPMLASREFFFAGLGNPLRRPILVRVRDVS